jgi:hypothetical protein
VGIEPTVSSFQGWRIAAFLPPEWTARELHPHFRRAEPASSCWTSSPKSGIRSQESGVSMLPLTPWIPFGPEGVEPSSGPYKEPALAIKLRA